MNKITVISSYKLKAAELKAVTALASKNLGIEGTVDNIVDKSVIAGVKIIGNGRELDLTLDGSITRMATAIA